MVKLFEKKLFFYICTVLAIIFTIIAIIFPTKDSTGIAILFMTYVFSLFALLALLIFFSNEHKELSKIMIVTILVIILLRYALSLFSQSYILIGMPSLIKATQINTFDTISKFLPNMIFPIISTIVFLAITLLIYINHCIINYANKPSLIAITFNHVLIFIFFMFTFITKIFIIFISKNPLTISSIISNIDVFFILLSVVCNETFINARREERTQKNINSSKQKKQ